MPGGTMRQRRSSLGGAGPRWGVAVAAFVGSVVCLHLMAAPALAQGRLPVGRGAADPTLWYLTRGAAATAYVLLTLSVGLGLSMNLRVFEGMTRAWRVLDLHQVVSLLMFAFIGLHLVTLTLDPFKPFSLLQVVWPLAETYRPLWVALGVLALYLLVAVVATSWLRRALGNRAWRAIHLTSYVAFVLVTLHGLFAGSDASTPWMQAVYWGATALVLYMALFRVWLRRGRARAPVPPAAPPAGYRPLPPSYRR